ncbi:MAG: hypothetical protein WCT42_02765 [Candidatus Paceibacterota bacterium]
MIENFKPKQSTDDNSLIELETTKEEKQPEEILIGKGWNPESSMGFSSWMSVMNNISNKISEHINKCLESVNFNKRQIDSLVVTNTISRGVTLKILSEALTKSNINCDIVALNLEGAGRDSREERKNEMENLIGRKIYTPYNFETSSINMMNYKHDSHGVKKYPGDMVSQKLPGVQEHINQARKMVDKISDGIIKQIELNDPLPSGEERFKKNALYVGKYWDWHVQD